MPSPSATARNQAGLGLPLAISILLLLAVVAAGVTQWMGAAREDVAAEVTSQRALVAARSGLEWGRVRVGDGHCGEDELTPAGAGDCTVDLRCDSISADGESLYALEAVGRCPLSGDITVERTLQMRVRPQP